LYGITYCSFRKQPPLVAVSTMIRHLTLTMFVVIAMAQTVVGQTLEEQLRQMNLADLAALARDAGDAGRGAVVFFQPHMACSKCHSVGEGTLSTLGPDLTRLGREVTDESLVESILLPSKVIRQGFESVTVVTANGRTRTGLLVERTQDKLVIRDVERLGELTTLATNDLDDVRDNSLSIMPAGQANQLTSRQQFLDLVKYLMEVRDGGAARARQLQPSPTLLVLTLPEYEQRIDHAGLIRDWNADSLQRGETIYRRVCQNCHGTRDQPGSLPTSPRFADGRFKNGSDPLAMYQTLTRGFGLMAAQTWMAPSQKYDVIHYVRETFLRPHNPSQFVAADDRYLAGLPRGDTRGPAPSAIEPWSAMDYGPSLTHTYEVPGGTRNFAYKGIAVRLDPGSGGVSRGRHWMVFDTDTLRMAAAWSASEQAGNFIDWRGIQFNGEHQIHPRLVGEVALANTTGPGWADPASGSLKDDQRVLGRDGRRYGPLPRAWARFRGLYHHGQQVVLSYTVGTTDVLESPRLLMSDDSIRQPAFLRTFNIGPRKRDLVLQVAEATEHDPLPQAGIAPKGTAVEWLATASQLQLKVPAGSQPLKFTIWARPASSDTSGDAAETVSREDLVIADADLDLAPLTRGGPPRWLQKLETRAVIGPDHGPFAVDVLTPPEVNPWLAQTRLTGLDFLADGRLAVCSWDGDVWLVEQPANAPDHGLGWQRIASGLFQPLGLKVIGDQIHVLCRDQLAVLHDLNGDGETDFYECHNNDHQVTEHFHEFAMGLQTDAAGDFYYAKSARHALPAIVPQHGTLLRVSRDGSRTEILANGFRAANGVCLNPDGSFFVTDQEGHWNPKNRINWVTRDPSGQPKFYGNLFGYTNVTDPSDSAMEPPLCWITNAFDRSPAELLWVDSDRWGPLNGSLLNLSYGYGKVFVVPHERVHGIMQGGLLELPIPSFPTGVMRGRFHPQDGQLYLCGMFAWAGNATHPGGLYRLRATGQPMHLVVELHASRQRLRLRFAEPLEAEAVDPRQVKIKTWSLKRTADYGSKHYDEKSLAVSGASLSADGQTLTLDVPNLAPTWCMEIAYAFRSAAGQPVVGVIHNTIHALGE